MKNGTMKQLRTTFDYAEKLSADMKAFGRHSTSENYRSASRSVLRFSGDKSLSLKTLFTREFLRDYEAFLTNRKCVRNTIAFYMKTLRAIYYKAIGERLITDVPRLFDDVFTGSETTVKRAVENSVIARIITGDLSAKPQLEICRDIFLLSLKLQGMTFVDMAYLRKSDLAGNTITYCRRKTGKIIHVVVISDAMELIKKHANRVKSSPYLFPLLTKFNKTGEAGETHYQTVRHRQNRQLKDIACHLGIDENLTTYVARHCWATMAYHGGTEIGVISQGMGHQTEETTRIYLSDHGRDKLERANLIVELSVLLPIANGETKNVCPQKRAEANRRSKEIISYLNRNDAEKYTPWSKVNGNEKSGWAGHVRKVGKSGRRKKAISRREEASKGSSGGKVYK